MCLEGKDNDTQKSHCNLPLPRSICIEEWYMGEWMLALPRDKAVLIWKVGVGESVGSSDFFSHVYVNPGLCAEHFLLSQLVSFLTWRFCSPCETDQNLKTWLWHFAHRLIPYWFEFVQTCFRCMFSPWLSVQFFFPGSPSLLTGAAAFGAWMVLPGLSKQVRTNARFLISSVGWQLSELGNQTENQAGWEAGTYLR